MEKEIIYINGIAVRRPKKQTMKKINLKKKQFRGSIKECSERLKQKDFVCHPNHISRYYEDGVPVVVETLNEILEEKLRNDKKVVKKFKFVKQSKAVA